jgi:hypothetical protein
MGLQWIIHAKGAPDYSSTGKWRIGGKSTN